MALTVLYDGRCRFCTRVAARLAGMDEHGRLRFVPLDAAARDRDEVRDLAASRDLSAALHVIDEQGRWAAGGAAMVRIWDELPATRPLVRLARLPLVARLVEPGYRFVAGHRSWFGRLAGSSRCGCGSEPTG